MSKIVTDNLFEYNNDGMLQFFPIDETDARKIYFDLIKDKDYLRNKIVQEEHLLDLLAGDNGGIKKPSIEALILLKDRLNKTKDKFESIKNWYDKNNIPSPGSSEDHKKIKLQKLYVEKVRERIVNEITPNSQNIKDGQGWVKIEIAGGSVIHITKDKIESIESEELEIEKRTTGWLSAEWKPDFWFYWTIVVVVALLTGN